MNEQERLLELRKKTGMNRKEFCTYFGIPYRTVQDWELGTRKMPGYLLDLMEYKANAVRLRKEKGLKKRKKASNISTGKDSEQ